jgi:phenylpropionate dioxygenase-like ring-hydroxylating dioxygenase large terminal subunit
MKLLRNAWYVAAWDTEVTRELFARDILGESTLMYRKEDGTPVAMSNRCPHRFAPLHKGKLVGDAVECPYHGLQFDCSGQCIKNPHPGGRGPIPDRAQLNSYPLLEKWGALWIWMGQKTPDPSLLPDCSWLDQRDRWREVRGLWPVNAHYELITDNLMDLTHLCYVHPGGLGSEPQNVAAELVEDVREGNTFWCKRSTRNVAASPDMRVANPILQEIQCDKNNNTRWNAPAHVAILVSYRKTGTVDEHLSCLNIAMMMTPRTASGDRTWHFWSIARNFRLDSQEVDAMIRHQAAVGLEQQDSGIIEAQWKNMSTSDVFRLTTVGLVGDTTPNRVRRVLAKMITDEQAELDSPTPDIDTSRTPAAHQVEPVAAQA